nr:hypothetical protein [Photobacterium leiognathi]
MDEVPAFLSDVHEFFDEFFLDNNPKPLELYLILGSAGCGKTTALKQLALKIADQVEEMFILLKSIKLTF